MNLSKSTRWLVAPYSTLDYNWLLTNLMRSKKQTISQWMSKWKLLEKFSFCSSKVFNLQSYLLTYFIYTNLLQFPWWILKMSLLSLFESDYFIERGNWHYVLIPERQIRFFLHPLFMKVNQLTWRKQFAIFIHTMEKHVSYRALLRIGHYLSLVVSLRNKAKFYFNYPQWVCRMGADKSKKR